MNARLLRGFRPGDETEYNRKMVQGIVEAEQTDSGVLAASENGETETYDDYELVGVEGVTKVWLRYEGSLILQNDVERAFEMNGGGLRVYFENGKQHTWEEAKLVRGARDA